MKKILIIIPALALLAGCSHDRGGTSYDSGMTSGSGTTYGATGSGTETMPSTGSSTTAQITRKEINFVREAGTGGLMEVQMGQAALANSANASIKSLGQRLVDDHTKANDQLKMIATQKGLTVPTQLSNSQTEMLNHLAALKGAEFDQAFQKHAVQDHEKDLKLYQKAASSLSDPELKAFAAQTIPILQQHLDMSKNLDSGVQSETK